MSSNLSIRTLTCAALIIFLIYNFSATLSTYICLPSGLTSTPPFYTATNNNNNNNNNDDDGDAHTMASPSHLHISLAQKSKSPPTVTIRVKNTHPSTPLSFVTWNTPLDPAVLPLGALVVADAATGERLNKDAIKIARKTPPDPDQFVTLRPGEERAQDVELKGPLVPLDKVAAAVGGKVKVSCEGAWGDVWEGEVGASEWEERSGKGVGGEYRSEAVEVEL